MNAKCLKCNRIIKVENTKQGFETGSDSSQQTCCDSKIEFEYEFTQSFFDPNIIDAIRSLPIGGIVPANLAERIEDNLVAKQV